MKPEKYHTTRRLAAIVLFASLVFSNLSFNPMPVRAQTNQAGQTASPSAPSDPLLADWTLDFDLRMTADQYQALGGPDQARAQVDNMLASKDLQGRGIQYQIAAKSSTVYRVSMQGSQSLGEVRQVLFNQLQPEMDLLGGVIAIDLTGPVQSGQSIGLTLEGRPSTGYAWKLDAQNSNGVIQSSEPVIQSEISQPSAPARVSLRLQGTVDGDARIRLVYSRPWESAAAPTRALTVKLQDLSAGVDLSNPAQPVESPAPALDDLPVVKEATVGLPTHFDWRDQSGKLPAVRDQGSCGGCWAFATVGAMEVAMRVQGNASADLSEQYLISCNKDGYGCNGGWWGHDYHVSKLGTNQTTAGAVAEADKPYTATDGTCSVNYKKVGNLARWGYVSGSYSSTPTTDQIKNAIYTYGSVSAAVCTGSGWSSYKSGVFSTDETSQCGSGQVNHGILLVGWDDASQYWILRNSWGPNWGENGYMRIKWNISNVGYGASYVVYNTTSPTPQPTATTKPTNTPTARPTNTPTKTATPLPTKTATKAPTQAPTATKAPTKAPTQSPTATKVPTQAPTTAPTQAPNASSNDDANNATLISYSGGALTYSDRIETGGATTNAADPYFPYTKKTQANHTVWYTFTPSYKGTLSANTTGSAYDTILGVWTKTSTGAWKLVKWNDNASKTRKQSALSFTNTAGTTYYFEVAAKTQTAGLLAFNLSYKPVIPGNDRLSKTGYINSAKGAAVNIKSAVDVSRAGATSDEPVLPDGRGRNYHTVWYKFKPVKSGTVTVTTSGSNYDTVAAAWKYASSKWNVIGMNDDWDGKQAGFQMKVTAGTSYLIGISDNTLSGPSLLNFSFGFQPD